MNQQPLDPQALHTLMAMMAIMPIFFVIGAVIVIIPLWFVWKKAGFSPWLSLLCVLPLVNLIMLYVLAFSEWKVAPVPQMPYPNQYPPAQYPRV